MNDISVVTSLYYSEEYIKEFYLRTLKVCEENFENFEIIFVNDGSPDNSSELVKTLCINDNRIKLIELSRNFGHHKALLTGLDFASKNLIWLIDVDLEDQPEWIGDFYKKLVKNNLDVVYGVQERRKGGIFERLTGALFYKFILPLLNVKIPKNFTTARLMTRRYYTSLIRYQERNSILVGLQYLVGYSQDFIKVSKQFTGNSTFTLRKKISLVIDNVTSFSSLPLEFSFYLGIFIFFIALIYQIYLICNWLFFSTPLLGWTSLMASLWLIGGLLIALIGLIGIYLSKVFIETKKRPYTTNGAEHICPGIVIKAPEVLSSLMLLKTDVGTVCPGDKTLL